MKAAVAALACLWSLVLGGCVCDEATAVFSSDWEYCDGTCEWVAQGTGTTRRVETIHPGEHGLRVDGQMVLTAPIAVTTGTIYNDGVWLEYTSTCGGAPSLRWQGGGGSALGLRVGFPPGGDGEGPLGSPISADRFRLRRISLPPVPGTEPGDPWDEGTSYLISELVLEYQSGTCVIDQLRLKVANECYW